MEITGIMEALGSFFGETIALINLSEHEATGIRGKASAGKIGDNLFGKKTFETELVMADCFHRASLLRSCFSMRYSILAHALFIFKLFC